MQTPYIPSTDAGFATWLANFSALLTAAPTDYGLVAGDAVIVAAANTDYQASLTLATDPGTRTPAAIAQKDADKAVAIQTVRPYAVSISLNMSVSDLLKVGIGVNLPNPTRPRIPAPLTNPDLLYVSGNPGVATLGYHDSTTPLTKAKPVGVTAMELRQTIGTAAATNPDTALFVDLFTKSPFTVSFNPGDAGKLATLWGRWRTKSGPAGIATYGPWSPALTIVVT